MKKYINYQIFKKLNPVTYFCGLFYVFAFPINTLAAENSLLVSKLITEFLVRL